MPFFNFNEIKISGIATAVPTEVVAVDSFIPVFGEKTVLKFKKMTGIKEYRKTAKNQTASDLGFAAAEKLLFEKEIEKDSIGALIYASHSHDYRRPSTAHVLHKRLKMSKECAVFDINLGCSAFVYGIQAMCALMQSSDIKTGLLIASEAVSKIVNPKDKSAVMLFGDAGSAILLEKSEDGNKIKGLMRSDGNGYKAIIAPAGGFRNMDASTESLIWSDGNERTLYNTNMNGADVFNFTISDVPTAVMDFLKFAGAEIDDYDCFAMHQANEFILKQISKKLKISYAKMPLSLDRFGNTSASTIPLTLCDTYGGSTDSVINTLMCGFGVGLSWGVLSAEIHTKDLLPIFDTDSCFEEGIISSPEHL